MIDKSTAFTIAGNDYRLCDEEGKEFKINGVAENNFKVYDSNDVVYFIKFNQIGIDFFILAHPIDNLTKEINGIIPIVELAKISFPKEDWILEGVNAAVRNNDTVFQFYYNYITKGFIHQQVPINRFDCFHIYHRPINNQLELFNYLNKNHFSHFLPEGSWLPIKPNK